MRRYIGVGVSMHVYKAWAENHAMGVKLLWRGGCGEVPKVYKAHQQWLWLFKSKLRQS